MYVCDSPDRIQWENLCLTAFQPNLFQQQLQPNHCIEGMRRLKGQALTILLKHDIDFDTKEDIPVVCEAVMTESKLQTKTGGKGPESITWAQGRTTVWINPPNPPPTPHPNFA